jgi:hypothetical protein
VKVAEPATSGQRLRLRGICDAVCRELCRARCVCGLCPLPTGARRVCSSMDVVLYSFSGEEIKIADLGNPFLLHTPGVPSPWGPCREKPFSVLERDGYSKNDLNRSADGSPLDRVHDFRHYIRRTKRHKGEIHRLSKDNAVGLVRADVNGDRLRWLKVVHWFRYNTCSLVCI